MLDTLPRKISNKNECSIINNDSIKGPGTHWTCYKVIRKTSRKGKKYKDVYYFDSYGDLEPPLELIEYWKSDSLPTNIFYNYERYQSDNSYLCGHHCLRELYSLNE